MRAFEILTEAKVGREFNHLEDLVFTDPVKGAVRAVEILRGLEKDSSDVAIKWDGNPTVFWGRDEDGSFRLVGKNNWGKEEGKSNSPEELAQFILSRGKGEEWRPQFAKDMAALWPIFERATPKDFRGYVFGDLLYHPSKPYQGSDGRITFTPNLTSYHVKAASNLGRRIAKSKVAVAATMSFENFGDPMSTGQPFENTAMFSKNPELVVLGQTYVDHRPAVDVDNLDKIQKVANNYQSKIKAFFEPVKGLSDLSNIFYTFINAMSRQQQLDEIEPEAFLNFIAQKVSAPKQARINKIIEETGDTLTNILFLIREIMKAKDEVIRELDTAEADITTTTGGKPGGEGYIKQRDRVKFVPRSTWKPF